MKDELLLVQNFKNTIFYIEKIIDNFPRSEKVLKDKIKSTNFDILELIYFSNSLELQQRIFYQKKIVAKLKMIDFYFKIACDRKYISYKKYTKVGGFLLNMIKETYGWIRYENKK